MCTRGNVEAAGLLVPQDHWKDSTSNKLEIWFLLVNKILLTVRRSMEIMVKQQFIN